MLVRSRQCFGCDLLRRRVVAEDAVGNAAGAPEERTEGLSERLVTNLRPQRITS